MNTLPNQSPSSSSDDLPPIPDNLGTPPDEDQPVTPSTTDLPETLAPPAPRPSSVPARPSQPGAAPTIPRGIPSIPPPVPASEEVLRLRALINALQRENTEYASHDLRRRIPLLGPLSGPQNAATAKLCETASLLLEEGSAAVKFWGDVLVASERGLQDLEKGLVPVELQRSMRAVVALVRKLRS